MKPKPLVELNHLTLPRVFSDDLAAAETVICRFLVADREVTGMSSRVVNPRRCETGPIKDDATLLTLMLAEQAAGRAAGSVEYVASPEMRPRIGEKCSLSGRLQKIHDTGEI